MKEKDKREKNLCERNEDRYGPLTPARSSLIHRKWDFSWRFQHKYRVRGSLACDQLFAIVRKDRIPNRSSPRIDEYFNYPNCVKRRRDPSVDSSTVT